MKGVWLHSAHARIIPAVSFILKMLKYLKKRADGQLLPSVSEKAFASANAQVEKEMKTLGKRKRSATTHDYDDHLKTKIGRYAAENGNASTVTKFSKDLGWLLLKAGSC